MKLTTIIGLLFLLSAFAIGISLQESDFSEVDNSIDKAMDAIGNISLTPQTNTSEVSIPNIEGVYLILEKYIHFIGTFVIEIMRAGIHFGYDNPDYFEAENIFYIIKWLLVLILISLLIQPVIYVVVIFILIGMWIKDKMMKRKTQKEGIHTHEKKNNKL